MSPLLALNHKSFCIVLIGIRSDNKFNPFQLNLMFNAKVNSRRFRESAWIGSKISSYFVKKSDVIIIGSALIHLENLLL